MKHSIEEHTAVCIYKYFVSMNMLNDAVWLSKENVSWFASDHGRMKQWNQSLSSFLSTRSLEKCLDGRLQRWFDKTLRMFLKFSAIKILHGTSK